MHLLITGDGIGILFYLKKKTAKTYFLENSIFDIFDPN
jgi:hypothetical protein